MNCVLSHEIYTTSAIDAGIAAFAHLLTATVEHQDRDTTITIIAATDDVVAELLNYVLGLSAQELLP